MFLHFLKPNLTIRACYHIQETSLEMVIISPRGNIHALLFFF